MGMAASQARQLALTARMSTVEYEASQIHQARTFLSQHINEIYDRLIAMDVPTPPVVTDFTKTTYSGIDGASGFEIGTITPTGTTYSVELLYNKIGHCMADSGLVKTKKDNNNDWYVGDNKIQTLNVSGIQSETLQGYIQAIRNTFPEYGVVDSNNNYVIDDSQVMSDFGVYFSTDENSNVRTYFVKMGEVEAGSHDNPDESIATKYEYVANGTYQESQIKGNCSLTFDISGRITNITIPVGNDEYKNIKLTVSTQTDEVAYEDAMNDYEYQKILYEKETAELNAKTKILQEEDRNLELRLTNADNLRNALKTELEAIKEVLKTNIDGSFKTFSA